MHPKHCPHIPDFGNRPYLCPAYPKIPGPSYTFILQDSSCYGPNFQLLNKALWQDVAGCKARGSSIAASSNINYRLLKGTGPAERDNHPQEVKRFLGRGSQKDRQTKGRESERERPGQKLQYQTRDSQDLGKDPDAETGSSSTTAGSHRQLERKEWSEEGASQAEEVPSQRLKRM